MWSSTNLFINSVPFVPPKPNEFDSAWIAMGRGVCGT